MAEQPLCGHVACTRRGLHVAVSREGQTHDCCGRHRCERRHSGEGDRPAEPCLDIHCDAGFPHDVAACRERYRSGEGDRPADRYPLLNPDLAAEVAAVKPLHGEGDRG